jgi:hypothetical protein
MSILIYIKRNFFEIITVGILTVAAVTRIMHPEIREQEKASIPLGSEFTEWAIILFELSSVYFLLFASNAIKHIYLVTLAIGMLLVSAYYLYICEDIMTYKETCVFLTTPHAVVLHIIYAMIFIYLAFIRK